MVTFFGGKEEKAGSKAVCVFCVHTLGWALKCANVRVQNSCFAYMSAL